MEHLLEIRAEVFTAIPVACAVSRLSDGMLLAINDEWCALTGLKREEAVGRTSTQLGIWRDEEQRQEFLSNRTDVNRIYTACASVEFKRKVRIRCREVRSDGVDLLIVCLTEATEEAAVRADLSKALEELSSTNLELRARIELHAEIERLAQVGAWTNEAGKSVVTWSDGLYAISGLPRGTALTRDSARKHIHPDDLEAWLSGREAMDGRPMEFRWLTPDGQTRWLRSRMSRSRVPVNPETDFGVVQDISLEHEVQQRLVKQLDLLNEVTLRVPGLMYQAFRRPDGRTELTFVSEPIVQMLELGDQEKKTDAHAIFSRVHPEDKTRLLEDLDRCGQKELDLRNSYRVLLPSGAERCFRFEASSRRQSDGAVLWHGYIADVTEERIARLALERQQQLLRAVSSALGHYIASDNKSEVFAGLLQSFREIVGSASLVLAEVTASSKPGAGTTTLDGLFLGRSDTFSAFTLTDQESNRKLKAGETVIVAPTHPDHQALCQGTPSSDPLVLLPLLAHLDLVGMLGVRQSDPNAVIEELSVLEPLTRAVAQILLAWRVHRERSSTLKRLAETTEQLSTQRRSLQVVLDSMGQGLAKLEADGHISFYNRRLLELLDIPDSLIASRPTYAQVSEFLARRGDFGKDYELVEGTSRDYVQSAGKANAPEVYLRRTREGRHLEIGTRVLPEGGCVRTITDVTQYMLAQEELTKERQRLAWILEATRPGTWENDLETARLTINDRWAELVGYTLEELSPVTNATWERLVHPDDLVKSNALRDAHLAGRAKFYECDVRMRHKEGHWVWINTRGRVHRRNNAGQALYMSGTHIDISERVGAQEALNVFNEQLECRISERTQSLERTLRDMEAIAYSIAHDLRTPLRSVNGFAEVLLESDSQHLSDAGKRSLVRIVGASARMGQMLTEMLDVLSVVRAEIGEDVVDMQLLISDVDQQLGLQSAGVNLVIDPMPNALGDERLLKQAFRNLMDNAAKYARDREPPMVHVGYEAGKGAYYVRDNGIGFDMAHAEKLFGLFQRLHGDSNIPGLGIGLAICSRIVERHGGRIWAEAIPGVGATFWIALPQETGETGLARRNGAPSALH